MFREVWVAAELVSISGGDTCVRVHGLLKRGINWSGVYSVELKVRRDVDLI